MGLQSIFISPPGNGVFISTHDNICFIKTIHIWYTFFCYYFLKSFGCEIDEPYLKKNSMKLWDHENLWFENSDIVHFGKKFLVNGSLPEVLIPCIAIKHCAANHNKTVSSTYSTGSVRPDENDTCLAFKLRLSQFSKDQQFVFLLLQFCLQVSFLLISIRL